jgi:DNA-binding PucR family transcriptional regulator
VALCRPQPLTRYADVALLTPWVNGSEPAGSLVDVYLAPLDQAPNGATLRATLRAYVDAGRNTKAAAAALGVDRGTVAKRLSAIESLYLGHPLHERMAELEVALRLEELHAARDGRHAGAGDALGRVEV